MMPNEKPTHHYELRAQSAKALLKRMYGLLADLAREETDLVKAEVAGRCGFAVAGGRAVAASLAFGTVALACLAIAAIAALATLAGVWPAALFVGVALLIVAALARTIAGHNFIRLSAPLHSERTDDLRERTERTRSQIDDTLDALETKTDLVKPIKDTVIGLGSVGVAVTAIVRDQTD